MIVNPSSGLFSSLKLAEYIKDKINTREFNLNVYVTSGRDDFIKVINQTDWNNTLLLLCGGDGSFNQVINEVIKNQIELKLVPVPCGTSNVYNYATQINIKNIADRINFFKLQGKRYRVGEVELDNGKVFYFFSVSGIGFDAHIVEKLHKMRRKKLYVWSYLTMSFEELLIRGYKPDRFRIFLDAEIIYNVFFAIVFNINAYGGPFHFAYEKGSYNDDFLHLVKFEKAGKSSIPSIYLYAFLNNLKIWKNFPAVQFMEIFVEPEESLSKIPIHIDGDPLGYLPAIIRKSEKSILVYS